MSSFKKNILILAPHPDDEIVGCCTAIQRAKKEGAELSVLFLSHGCIVSTSLWPWQRDYAEGHIRLRQTEAEESALMLGLHIIGFMDRPTRFLWREMEKVRTEINAAINTFGFDQLWIPAYEGGHSDHDALNGLCQFFKKRMSVLEFAEYNYASGKSNSQTFPEPNGTETIISLTTHEQNVKKSALAIYASEAGNLDYVETEQECFRPLADYDYSRPPHEGKLWYTRFHWVPFKHPRIDFSKPTEVSNAIVAFLTRQHP